MLAQGCSENGRGICLSVCRKELPASFARFVVFSNS